MKNRMLVVSIFIILVVISGCSKHQKEEKNLTDDIKEKNPGTQVSTEEEFWANSAVIYQINVRTFCDSDNDKVGDFNGVVQKIDYLKDLGVNTVFLMSVMEANTNTGYDILNYYSVESDYGTEEDFCNMVDALHDNGFKVLIDFNVNFSSMSNEWFKEALKNPDGEAAEYYHIFKEKPADDGEYYHLNEASGLWYWAHYSYNLPNLNYTSAILKDKIKEVAGYWIDKGVDGFVPDRCKRFDTDETVVHKWWKEFQEYVDKCDKDVFVLGRITLYSYDTLAPYLADMNSAIQFPYKETLYGVVNGTAIDFVAEYNESMDYYDKYIGAEDSTNNNFVYTTALGDQEAERIATRVTSTGDSNEITIKKTKFAAALQLTSPGTPIIMYGDEIGMKEGKNGGELLTCLKEAMDWNKICMGDGVVSTEKAYGVESKYSFPSDGISVEEQIDDEESILSYYKTLLKIRNNNPVMAKGEYTSLGLNGSLIAYTINGAEDESTILVVHNASVEDKALAINVDGKELIKGSDIKAGNLVNLGAYDTVMIKYSSETSPVNAEEFISAYSGEKQVKITVTLPTNTPENEYIYITGNFNNWNVSDPNYVMTRTSSTTCELTIPMAGMSSIEYKITRGDWDKREQNKAGEDKLGDKGTSNRSYVFDPENNDIQLTVEKWMDK